MTDDERVAQKRYYIIMGTNLIAVAGTVLGLLIAGRARDHAMTVFGGAVVLSSLYMMAVVPRALARRWRTPPAP